MIRRTAFAALSVAAAPLLVGATSHVAAAAEASDGLSDARYRQLTLRFGTLAKLTSELVPARTARSEVRQFARFEIAEQTSVAQVLTDLENPPPAPLTREQQQVLAQLRSLTGVPFDRAYVQAQMRVHKQLRFVQQTYLRDGGNRNLRDVARLVNTVVNEHLVHLRTLERLLQG